MTSEIDDSRMQAAKRLRTMISNYSLSPQEQERRTRAQQRLKEVYSSIPWYKEQAEKYGDQFWERLHGKAVLSD